VSRVLITGACGGLGRALCRGFAQRGATLLLTDLDATALEALAAELSPLTHVEWLAGDITEPALHQQLLERVETRLGGLDVLVNNAGITHRSLVAKTQSEVLRRVMRVDWQAPLELAVTMLPALQQSRGTIINMGSMAGWIPVLGRGAYCAAKSALTQSFEVLRCEQRAHGVHILMAYPSFLQTDIEKNALGFDGAPATHARSTIGVPKDTDWFVARLLRALDAKKDRVYSDYLSRAGKLLWQLCPSLYLSMMTKNFQVELQQ